MARRRPPTAEGRLARVYATVLAVAMALFAALGATTLFWAWADEMDVRFVRWVHDVSPDALVETMRVVTHAGSTALLGPLALVLAVVFLRSRRPAAAVFILAAVAGAWALSQLAKAGFRRARPELEDPFVLLTTYSFPSGHAFSATATWGALALMLAAAATGRRRAAILAAGAAVIALVAASRVVLGVHYLLDVIAGIAGGVALLAALLLLLQNPRRPGLRLVLFARDEQPQRAGLGP